MTDNAGATSTANTGKSVTGTNDAPVAQAASFTVAEDAAVVNRNGDCRPWTPVPLSYALNGAAPAGLTFNSNGARLQPRQRAAYPVAAWGQSTVSPVSVR